LTFPLVGIKTTAQIIGGDPRMLFDPCQHGAAKQKRAAVKALPEIVFTAQDYGKSKKEEKGT
jgi:hypothetical protein